MADMNPSDVSDEEFEYIELEEGQELPEGYEYEYVEVPADEVSEMDVVNRSYAINPEEENYDMASASDINAALSSSQEEDVRPEAPFPSFLTADANDDQVADVVSEETEVSDASYNNEEWVEVDDVRETDTSHLQLQQEVKEEEWQSQVGSVAPVSDADTQDMTFMNAPSNPENWQEDTRATYDLNSIQEDVSDIQFNDEKIPSIDVNDYIEPEAVYKTSDVALTDLPQNISETQTTVSVEEVEDNSFLPQNSETENAVTENDFDNLNFEENDVSLDELLQDDNPSHEEISPENIFSTVEDTVVAKDNLLPTEEVLEVEEVSSEPIAENFVQESVKTEEVSVNVPVEETIFVSDEEPLAKEIPSHNENYVSDISEQQENIEVAPLAVSDVEMEVIPDVITSEPEIETPVVPTLNGEDIWEEVDPEVRSSSIHPDTFETVVEKPQLSEETLTNANQTVFQSEQVIRTSDDVVEHLDPLPSKFQISEFSLSEAKQAERSSRIVSKQNGVQAFKGDDVISDILLSDIDFAHNELAVWNLILYHKSIIPLEKQVTELNRAEQSCLNRFACVIQGGNRRVDLFNEDNLKIINASNACVSVQGRFICGDFASNSGVIIDDFVTIPLVDFAGKKISFEEPVSGLLTGAAGFILFFHNVKNLWIPSSEIETADAQKLQYKISRWYSGTLHDKYFEFSAQSESAEFSGNDEVKSIHVNVNNSSYGWNATFDNGISMNLRDLREYQTRFGKLPSANGVISYGQKSLKFQNVDRIVVYEAAQYFFYS